MSSSPSKSTKHTLINGALGIVVVATLMTLFEFVFFYSIVFPGIKTAVNGALASLTRSCDSSATALLTLFAPADIRRISRNFGAASVTRGEGARLARLRAHVDPNVNTLIRAAAVSRSAVARAHMGADVEDALGDISEDLKAVVFTAEARENRLRASVNRSTKAAFVVLLSALGASTAGLTAVATTPLTAYASALVTVALLIAFQLRFYKVGLNWKYMGSEGVSELQYGAYRRIAEACGGGSYEACGRGPCSRAQEESAARARGARADAADR